MEKETITRKVNTPHDLESFGVVKSFLDRSMNRQVAKQIIKQLEADEKIDKAFMFYLGGSHLSVLDKKLRKEVLFILLK